MGERAVRAVFYTLFALVNKIRIARAFLYQIHRAITKQTVKIPLAITICLMAWEILTFFVCKKFI
jgi:hypothetical protein